MKAKNVEPWLMGHRIWASDYDYFKSLNWEDTGWRDSEFAVTTNFTIEHSGQRGVFEKEKVGR